MSKLESLAGKFFKANLGPTTNFRYYYLKKRIKDDIYIFDSFDLIFTKRRNDSTDSTTVNLDAADKVYENLMKDLEITPEEYNDALEIFKSRVSKLWEISRKVLIEKM